MSRLRSNLIYQTAYQILAIALPLITTPVITRNLGADGLGQYSYTNAIVSYFALFALLGVNSYGVREIAQARNSENKDALNEAFSGIFSLQMILSIIVIVAYYAYVLLFVRKYVSLAMLQGFALLGTIVDINWFYFGMEQFRVTVTRNLVIKVVCAIIIIFFIKEPSDIYLYAFTLVGSTVVSNFVLAFGLRHYVKFRIPKRKLILCHLKPNLILFIPVVAASLYTYVDKIMIGAIAGTFHNGCYEAMEKLINVPNACIAALITVMFPRISVMVTSKANDKIKNYIQLSMLFVMTFSSACFFGMLGVAKLFVPLFLGEEFTQAVYLIIVGTLILLPRGARNIVKSEYLLPHKKDKEVTVAFIASGIANVIINLFFIPRFGAMGATIATIVAETTSCALMFYWSRSAIALSKMIVLGLPFVLFGLIMYVTIRFAAVCLTLKGWFLLFALILIGGTVYSVLSIAYVYLIKRSGVISL